MWNKMERKKAKATQQTMHNTRNTMAERENYAEKIEFDLYSIFPNIHQWDHH